MCTGNDGFPAGKPFGWPGVVEAGGLRVKLHVPRVDTWPVPTISKALTRFSVKNVLPVDPGIIQVILTTFDQKDSEVPVQIGQAACHYASCRAPWTSVSALCSMLETVYLHTPTHNDVDFLRNRHVN